MTTSTASRSLAAAALALALVVPAAAQSVVGKGKTGPAPDPVNLDITGLFQAKFASVGLRVRRGGSYHGLAINVNMDLAPFARINPCGYAGLAMTQLATLGGPRYVRQVAEEFTPLFARRVMLSACAGAGAAAGTVG